MGHGTRVDASASSSEDTLGTHQGLVAAALIDPSSSSPSSSSSSSESVSPELRELRKRQERVSGFISWNQPQASEVLSIAPPKAQRSSVLDYVFSPFAPGRSYGAVASSSYLQPAKQVVAPQLDLDLVAAKAANRYVEGDRVSFDKPREGVRNLGDGTLHDMQTKALNILSACALGKPEQPSINQFNFSEYVRASLGLAFVRNGTSEDFQSLAHELSKNSSTWALARQSIPRSAVKLAAALFIHQKGWAAFKNGALDAEGFKQFIAVQTERSRAEVDAAIKDSYLTDITLIGQGGAAQIQFSGKPPLVKALSDFHVDEIVLIQENRNQLSEAVQSIARQMETAPVKSGRRDWAAPAAARSVAATTWFERVGQSTGDEIGTLLPIGAAGGEAATAVQAGDPAQFGLGAEFEQMYRTTAQALAQLPLAAKPSTYPSAELRHALYALEPAQLSAALQDLSGPQLEDLVASNPGEHVHPSDAANPDKKAIIDHAFIQRGRRFTKDLIRELQRLTEVDAIGARAVHLHIHELLTQHQDNRGNFGWLASAASASAAVPGDNGNTNWRAQTLREAISKNINSFSIETLERLSSMLRSLAPRELASTAVTAVSENRNVGFADTRLSLLKRLNERRIRLLKKEAKGALVMGTAQLRTKDIYKDEFAQRLQRIQGSQFSDEAPAKLSVRFEGEADETVVALPANFVREIGDLLANGSVRVESTNLGAFVGQSAQRNDARAAELAARMLANHCRSKTEFLNVLTLLTQTSANVVFGHDNEAFYHGAIVKENPAMENYMLGGGNSVPVPDIYIYRDANNDLHVDMVSTHRQLPPPKWIGAKLDTIEFDQKRSDYSTSAWFKISTKNEIAYDRLSHESVLLLK